MRRNAELWLVGLFLLFLTGVGLAAYTPWLGLVGDDWWFFSHLSDGEFLAAQLIESPARPALPYLWVGLYRLLGLRLPAYYFILFGVQWLTALLVFVLLRRICGWSVGFSATAAAFFLLYPADTAHVYLDSLGIRVCMLLAIGGALLWLQAWTAAKRPPILLAAGLILMSTSLLIYEMPLFLLALLPIVLARLAWRGWWTWLRQAFSCYLPLAAYTVFRLEIEQRPTRFYASMQLTPDWFWAQLQAVPAAAIWNGWLYALKVMLDFGPVTSVILLTAFLALLLPAVGWLRQDAIEEHPDRRRNLALVGLGAILSVAAVAPVIVSSVSLRQIVGTLQGRLVVAAALGHSILVLGSCALLGSVLPLTRRGHKLLQTTLASVLLALALIDGLGVQREYAQAWRAQLDILQGIQAQAPGFRNRTALVLLNVPAGAFDIRFYYPFTELVRRFYGNPTLYVLPWQRGFPPEQQALMFGRQGVAAITELVSGETQFFDYDHLIAFQIGDEGEIRPVTVIGAEYLVTQASDTLSSQLPENWEPAREPIQLPDPQHFATAARPPDTNWSRFLLAQLQFANRFELPGGALPAR